jgi:hypothetical protein
MTNNQADTALELLCCELAAIETYQQALELLREGWSTVELRQLRADHWDAAHALRRYLRCPDSSVSQAARLWGDLQGEVVKPEPQDVKQVTLSVLRRGEEFSTRSYSDALHDDLLPSECQTLVRTKLLPQTQTHVSVLNRLLEARG